MPHDDQSNQINLLNVSTIEAMIEVNLNSADGGKKNLGGLDDLIQFEPSKKLEEGEKVDVNEVKRKKEKRVVEMREELGWREYLMIFNIITGDFCLSSMYALLTPFFPKEAELKNNTPIQYGLVFSIFEFGVFLFSPLAGKLMPRIMPRRSVIFGLIGSGLFCCAFGLLQWFPPGMVFFGSAMFFRILASFAAAFYYTASHTAVAYWFPNRVTQLFALKQLSFGSGMIVGPAIGGFLFELGDFMLPFMVIGVFAILCAFAVIFFMKKETKALKQEKGPSLFGILCRVPMIMNFFILFTSFMLVGMNQVSLEQHTREVS